MYVTKKIELKLLLNNCTYILLFITSIFTLLFLYPISSIYRNRYYKKIDVNHLIIIITISVPHNNDILIFFRLQSAVKEENI